MLSIIIPVLNDEAPLARLLGQLNVARGLAKRAHPVEIVVVDGGSHSSPEGLCDRYDALLINSPPGRAVQMNAGATAARGSLFWFLHADTQLSAGTIEVLLDTIAHRRSAWGRFDIELAPTSPLLVVVAWMMNLRSRITGIATGDQGIFVDRELFERVGGYPEIELMEDVALSRRLKRYARPLCLRLPIVTSSRRWQARGTLRTILLMWWLRLAYRLGIAPATLARWYR